MRKQPVYRNAPAYVNGVSERIFKVGMCLPAGLYVSDDDIRYIVECIGGDSEISVAGQPATDHWETRGNVPIEPR